MKTNQKPFALGIACAVAFGASTLIHAQTISIYTGAGDTDTWSNPDNWDTGSFPDAPDALAQFGALDDPAIDRANILFSSASHATLGVLEVSGLMFLQTLNSTADPFLVRNSSTTTAGTLRIHGYATTIGGNAETLLIGHFGSGNVRLAPTNAGYVTELNNSGVIHNEGPGLLRISTEVTEAGGAQSITKTGSGTLRFDRWSSTQSSEHSTYSGGFTLQQGIVEWTNSGGSSANPFGLGPLTLQGGNLRSTTDSGRTVNTGIVLDGGAAIGSLDEGFTGNVAINSAGGSLSTTIVSDSTVTIHNQTTWHQGTFGSFGLTKDGGGTLIFSGTGGTAGHEGATVVEEGTLLVNTTMTDSAVTIEAGATLGFGTAASVGQGTFGSTLAMEDESILFFRLNAIDSFDSLVAMDSVGLDGAVLDIELGFAPVVNDVFLLVDNQGGQTLDGLLSYGGETLTEGSEFTVTTGEFSQLFAISYEAGEFGDGLGLTAIPEPSTWGLLSGLAIFGAVAARRRWVRGRMR